MGATSLLAVLQRNSCEDYFFLSPTLLSHFVFPVTTNETILVITDAAFLAKLVYQWFEVC